MMQLKLATKLNQILPRVLRRRNLGAITGGGRTADPDTHAVNPEEVNDASEAAKAAPASSSGKDDEDDPYIPPRNTTLSESSPRIQSAGVNQLKNPHGQQRRRRRFSSAAADIDVDCVGIDAAAEEEDRAAQEEDNKEYFKHHRASPLSELEIAETRKPITRAAGGGSVEGGYFGSSEMEVWRPEQIDTAEEAMRRAREIWMSNAIRGDPDSPHGRVLRKLRGEDW